MGSPHGDCTEALAAAHAGEHSAMDVLMPVVSEELHSLANSFFARQPKEHLLQPTAVLHEAFLKLVGGNPVDWQDRAHFLAVAARVMRQILTDHAREKKIGKTWRAVAANYVVWIGRRRR